MNPARFSRRTAFAAFGTLVALVSLVGAVSPLVAQQDNQSDISGPAVNGTQIVGGNYSPPVDNPGGGDGGQAAGGPAAPAAAAAPAVAGAAANIQGSMGAGVYVAATPPGAVVDFAVEVQSAVVSVLSGEGPPTALDGALDGAGAAALPSSLTSAVHGLLADPSPARLGGALQAYNQFVAAAEPSFLANPPAEFQLMGAVLGQMVTAATPPGATGN